MTVKVCRQVAIGQKIKMILAGQTGKLIYLTGLFLLAYNQLSWDWLIYGAYSLKLYKEIMLDMSVP
jgi:hypothetical protein